ncbi:histidine kinase N-terminal 7TM domain-containing protein [Chloroflexota bacterium]
MIHVLYLTFLAISAVLAAVLAFFFWRCRPKPGAAPIAWLMLAAVIISVGYILQYTSANLSTQIFATNIQYVGIMALPVLWVVFSIQYTGHSNWLTRRNLLLLSIIPFVTVVLVWTNGIDGLMYHGRHLDTSGPFAIITKTYGPWFWIAAANNYLLIAYGMLLLLQRLFRSPRLYRQQSITLLISIIVPLVWNVVYIFKWTVLDQIDLTPSAFVISGLAMAWGLYRVRLFDIIPVARDIVIECMSNGVVVLDVQNRFIDLNRAAERIVGCTSSEAIGQAVADVLSEQPNLVELFCGITDVAEEHVEVEVAEGETQYYYASDISLIHDRRGYLIGRLIILSDITEHKQAAGKLQKHYDEENKLLTELETEVNKRIEFTRVLVHELKTPLTPMIVASGLLMEEIPEGTSFRLARSINKGALTLSTIIGQLIDVAKGEMGILELDRKETNLIDLLQKIAEDMTPLYSSHKQLFNLELPVSLSSIWIDAERLRQVVVNLLDNSFKFTPKGGKITLRAEEKDNFLIVEVEDTGLGISMNQKRHLFEAYYRPVSKSQSSKGLGLGLPISKMLIELHGGRYGWKVK